MAKSSIRVDILIPLYYNDGTEIEDEKFATINDILIDRFKGYTQYNGDIQGSWRSNSGIQYTDKHKQISVICFDTRVNRIFFEQFKKQLEELLNQESIFITAIKNVVQM